MQPLLALPHTLIQPVINEGSVSYMKISNNFSPLAAVRAEFNSALSLLSHTLIQPDKQTFLIRKFLISRIKLLFINLPSTAALKTPPPCVICNLHCNLQLHKAFMLVFQKKLPCAESGGNSDLGLNQRHLLGQDGHPYTEKVDNMTVAHLWIRWQYSGTGH